MLSSRPRASQLMPALVALTVVAVLLALGRVFDTFPGDEWALLGLRDLRCGWLDRVALVASAIGMGGIGWAITVPWIPLAVVAGTLLLRRWTDAAFLALATLAPVVNLGLKELVARPRPDPALAIVVESGYGFPSSHAVFAAAFLGALLLIAYRSSYLSTRGGLRGTAMTLLLVLILAVGFSRVYLGVHWPSDVVAGLLVGAAHIAAIDVARHLLPAAVRIRGRPESSSS